MKNIERQIEEEIQADLAKCHPLTERIYNMLSRPSARDLMEAIDEIVKEYFNEKKY